MHNELNLEASWGVELEGAVCERCDWSYLLPAGSLPRRCPRCFQAELSPLKEQLGELTTVRPPELLLPFTLSATAVAGQVQRFAEGIPFAPGDLTPQNLQSRLRRVYFPMWLVDADVQAAWQAEAGFDYQVVSHQDRYDDWKGGWSSNEVKEGRVRWEPRLGRLTRKYQNIPAPALEEHARLQRALGEYDLAGAQAYQAEGVKEAAVRLPDRSPQDAWSEAAAALQAAGAEECRRAAGADHIRQFSWQPEYQNQNWTLLLLPMYATYYLDDERAPQPVYFQGQTGQASGARRASMKRAQQTALILVGIAALLLLAGLLMAGAGVVMPPLMVFGVIFLVLGGLLALGALAPLAVVWSFNRKG